MTAAVCDWKQGEKLTDANVGPALPPSMQPMQPADGGKRKDRDIEVPVERSSDRQRISPLIRILGGCPSLVECLVRNQERLRKKIFKENVRARQENGRSLQMQGCYPYKETGCMLIKEKVASFRLLRV